MRIRVLSRVGDPFEEPDPSKEVPKDHLEALNALFFDGSVDLGGKVEIDGVVYVCTRKGWGVATG